MTNVTEVLGNESGIQYQGVNDASGGTGSYPTIGMIVGQFRRGRIDRPMTVTNSNIRALLGYEPENLDYTNVQDVLDSGVPSVQVLRVVTESINNYPIPDWCPAEHVSPLVLKNKFYNFTDDNILCIAIRYTDLVANEVKNVRTLEIPLTQLRDEDSFYVPNVTALHVPNNITSKYYRLQDFLKELEGALANLSPQFQGSLIPQGTTVKQTFIGLMISTVLINQENRIMLTEMRDGYGVINDFGGMFTYTPTSESDAINQVYNHFQPILEQAGFTVSYYNVSSYFIPNYGFKLAKTSNYDSYFKTENPDQGTNNKWDGSWPSYYGENLYFQATDAISPLVTEEAFKDNISLTLSPLTDGEQAPIRYELLSYSDAGRVLPTNGVDWIEQNNNGNPMIIDSCFVHPYRPPEVG